MTGTVPDETAVAIRVAMPQQLRTLARVSGQIEVTVEAPVTLGAVLDALEERHPELRGTIRDRETLERRAMIRLYAAGEDLSDAAPTTRLPDEVARGREPLRLVGAIAGG